jgi:hypothetical protein
VVNFDVRTFDGTGSSIYFFSARAAVHSAGVNSDDAGLASSGLIKVNGATATLITDPDHSAGIRLVSNASEYHAAKVDRKTSGVISTPDTCVDQRLSSTPNILAWVGYTDSDTSDANESFTYSEGGTSSIGVGVSTSASWVNTSQSGTRTTTSNITTYFPEMHGLNTENYFVYMTYSKISEVCGNRIGSTSDYLFEPTSYTGGSAYKPAPKNIGMGKCTGEYPNTTFSNASSSAYESGVGVSTGGVINISLSAQSGYSSQIEQGFHTLVHGHPWCGLSDYPAGSPKLLNIHASIWTGP